MGLVVACKLATFVRNVRLDGSSDGMAAILGALVGLGLTATIVNDARKVPCCQLIM